ncbi:MAG: hypothetical protein ABI689_13570 [Thermoanaerobaculia bacterium]
MHKRMLLPILAIALAAVAPSATFAQGNVDSLRDLVGQRASTVESQMNSRGYRFMRAETSSSNSFGYWSEPRTNQCISVLTNDGRVQFISYTENWKCSGDGYDHNNNPGNSNPPSTGLSDEDHFDTVCGVNSRGQSNRFRCAVRNEGCGGEGFCKTIVTYPDQQFWLTWQKNDSVEVAVQGVNPEQSRTRFSDGLTYFNFGGNEFFFYRSPERARKELANFQN